MKDKQYKQLMNNNDNCVTSEHVFVRDLCAKQRFREEMKTKPKLNVRSGFGFRPGAHLAP